MYYIFENRVTIYCDALHGWCVCVFFSSFDASTMMMMRVSIAHDEKVTNNNTGKEDEKKTKNKKTKNWFSPKGKCFLFFLRNSVLLLCTHYTHHYDEFHPHQNNFKKTTQHTKNIEYRNDNLSLYIAHPSRFSSSSFSTVEMRNSLLTSYMSIISGVNRIKWRARQETRIIIFFFFF